MGQEIESGSALVERRSPAEDVDIQAKGILEGLKDLMIYGAS
jgi:hypothetical protein